MEDAANIHIGLQQVLFPTLSSKRLNFRMVNKLQIAPLHFFTRFFCFFWSLSFLVLYASCCFCLFSFLCSISFICLLIILRQILHCFRALPVLVSLFLLFLLCLL